MRLVLIAAIGLWASLAAGSETSDQPEVRRVAEKYLNAATDSGDESGKELLLGGATANAQLFSLENWRIVTEEPVQREEGDLAEALLMKAELDKEGHAALAQVLDSPSGRNVEIREISREDATKLLAPTKQKAARFVKAHPVLAYVTRVGKEVYWSPKNPARPMLAAAGKSGRYSLELHRFIIETKEGPRQEPRRWPLRVLRFRTANLDSGWKILPASDWNAE